MDDIDSYMIRLTKKKETIDIDILNECGFIVYCCSAYFNSSNGKYVIQLYSEPSIKRTSSKKSVGSDILLHHNIVEIIDEQNHIISLALTQKTLIDLL